MDITNVPALRKASAWTAMVVASLFSAPIVAAPVTDCPSRNTPFSTRSPLIDVLLDARAGALVKRSAPELGKGLPPFFQQTSAPTFAAILTVRDLARFQGLATGKMDDLDRQLARLKVTARDRIERCARYDNNRPTLSPTPGSLRFLLFEKINGFRDSPSVDAAHQAFLSIAARHGWSIAVTDKGGSINPATLAHYDAVIWNNISGDVLTLAQRRAFRQFLQKGGGFVGVHGSAGDPVYFWNWYADRLIGARFIGHPNDPQFQSARIRVEPTGGAVARGLPAEWTMTDEWYSFASSPRQSGATIVATLDERSYRPVGMHGQDLRMGDHPIAWTRTIGRGRAFYSAIGHRPETYGDPTYVRLLEQAMDWAATSSRSAMTAPPGPGHDDH